MAGTGAGNGAASGACDAPADVLKPVGLTAGERDISWLASFLAMRSELGDWPNGTIGVAEAIREDLVMLAGKQCGLTPSALQHKTDVEVAAMEGMSVEYNALLAALVAGLRAGEAVGNLNPFFAKLTRGRNQKPETIAQKFVDELVPACATIRIRDVAADRDAAGGGKIDPIPVVAAEVPELSRATSNAGAASDMVRGMLEEVERNPDQVEGSDDDADALLDAGSDFEATKDDMDGLGDDLLADDGESDEDGAAPRGAAGDVDMDGSGLLGDGDGSDSGKSGAASRGNAADDAKMNDGDGSASSDDEQVVGDESSSDDAVVLDEDDDDDDGAGGDELVDLGATVDDSGAGGAEGGATLLGGDDTPRVAPSWQAARQRGDRLNQTKVEIEELGQASARRALEEQQKHAELARQRKEAAERADREEEEARAAAEAERKAKIDAMREEEERRRQAMLGDDDDDEIVGGSDDDDDDGW